MTIRTQRVHEEAARLYPLAGDSPDTVIALRDAFREGVKFASREIASDLEAVSLDGLAHANTARAVKRYMARIARGESS